LEIRRKGPSIRDRAVPTDPAVPCLNQEVALPPGDRRKNRERRLEARLLK
jgi:hypothetical protein